MNEIKKKGMVQELIEHCPELLYRNPSSDQF